MCVGVGEGKGGSIYCALFLYGATGGGDGDG